MTAITNDQDDTPPQGLWRALRLYFEWLLNVIGDSADVGAGAHKHAIIKQNPVIPDARSAIRRAACWLWVPDAASRLRDNGACVRAKR